jgi:hypothetical protein
MPGAGRRFQKGTSGNPSGRPKSDRTIAEMAREHCPKAIQALVEIMCDRKVTPAARVSAAGHLIDRGYGRPPQTNTLIAATPRSAASAATFVGATRPLQPTAT